MAGGINPGHTPIGTQFVLVQICTLEFQSFWIYFVNNRTDKCEFTAEILCPVLWSCSVTNHIFSHCSLSIHPSICLCINLTSTKWYRGGLNPNIELVDTLGSSTLKAYQKLGHCDLILKFCSNFQLRPVGDSNIHNPKTLWCTGFWLVLKMHNNKVSMMSHQSDLEFIVHIWNIMRAQTAQLVLKTWHRKCRYTS